MPGSSPSLGKSRLPGRCFFMSIRSMHRFLVKTSQDWLLAQFLMESLLLSETQPEPPNTVHLTLTTFQPLQEWPVQLWASNGFAAENSKSSRLFPKNSMVILSQQRVFTATGRRQYPMLQATKRQKTEHNQFANMGNNCSWSKSYVTLRVLFLFPPGWSGHISQRNPLPTKLVRCLSLQ